MGHLSARQLKALDRLSEKSQDYTLAIAKLQRATRGSDKAFSSAMANVVAANSTFEDAKVGFCKEFGNDNITAVLGAR